MIAADADFEVWYLQRHVDGDSEVLYKEALARAKAFVEGYRQGLADLRLQSSSALEAELDNSEPASRSSVHSCAR